VNYTNAATIISADYKDAEDNDGVFSGLVEYKGGVPEWPYNGFVVSTTIRPGSHGGARVGDQGRVAATAQSGEVPGSLGHRVETLCGAAGASV